MKVKRPFVKRFGPAIVGLIALIGVGSVAFFGLGGSDESSGADAATFTVKRDDLTIEVTENGDIKAINTVDIKSEVEGRATIISLVDEGTVIRPEDVNVMVLCELDSSDIKQKLTQQEIKYLSAEASYANSKEALDIQKKQNDSDIQNGRMAVRFALMDFKKYLGEIVAKEVIEQAGQSESLEGVDTGSLLEVAGLGGEASQRLKELTDEIVLAESKYEQASDRLMWTEKLFGNQYVAETELRKDRLELQSTKIKKEKAEIDLELFKIYEFPKQTEKLFGDCLEAKRDLDRVEASARAKLVQAQAKLKSAKATYSLEKELLAKWEKQLAACMIIAPTDGQVVYGSSMLKGWMRQRRLIEIGAEVRERQKIICIPDQTKMKVEIKVHENWIDKVDIGQEAEITVAAFPDDKFTGKVLTKAPLADPTEWFNPDLKVYATDVSLDGTHDSIKTGMSAKVKIIINRLKNVLLVPIQAVATQEGVKVCYVSTGGGSDKRKVELGQFNNDFVEIKSGLSEGDRVLLNPPRITNKKNEKLK